MSCICGNRYCNIVPLIVLVFFCAGFTVIGCDNSSKVSSLNASEPQKTDDAQESSEPKQANENQQTKPTEENKKMTEFGNIWYLEIVSSDVDATCKLYSAMHGVEFSEPVAAFGNARTTEFPGGGKLGIRAPMRETETPVVRPYVLVEDIDAAVKIAGESGAQVAMPPMELPGHGRFAIIIEGGAELGLWESQ